MRHDKQQNLPACGHNEGPGAGSKYPEEWAAGKRPGIRGIAEPSPKRRETGWICLGRVKSAQGRTAEPSSF